MSVPIMFRGYDYTDFNSAAEDAAPNVLSTINVPVAGGYVGDDAHDIYLPGGHAIGRSPRARLWAGPDLVDAVIQTANYGSATAYRSLFASLWVDGGKTINVNSPYTWHEGESAVASGIRFDGYSGGVYANFIERCKGWGIEGTRSQEIESLGAVGIPMSRFSDNDIVRCFGGLKISSGDSFITGNMVNQVRDHGLWITTSGGSNKVIGNHLYGCGASGSFADSGGTSGCACRCDLASFFDSNDLSDSDYGLYLAANADFSTLNNCRIQNNHTYGVYALGTIHISNSYFSQNNSGSVALYLDGGAPRCQVIGGEIGLSAANTKGIMAIGRQCQIKGLDLTGNGAANQIGIEVNSPNMNGQEWHISLYGFNGSGAAGLKILDLGSHNKFFITTDYTEGSDHPLSIDSAVWTAGGSSGNSVIIDGTEVTSGSH